MIEYWKRTASCAWKETWELLIGKWQVAVAGISVFLIATVGIYYGSDETKAWIKLDHAFWGGVALTVVFSLLFIFKMFQIPPRRSDQQRQEILNLEEKILDFKKTIRA